MISLYDLFFLVLGLIGGTLSGLLGIGGGLVIVPLLLYAPQWLGFGEIDIRTASAVAVVQVTAATLSGALAHRRRGGVNMRLAVTMSVASASGALIGGVTSAYVPAGLLLITTATLATTAALLMFLPSRAENLEPGKSPTYNVIAVLISGLLIGLVIGMNGAGAFLMMPTLIYLVGLPTRIALGTVLAVGFPTSLAAAVGKIATGQVPLWLAALVVVGAIFGAQVGSWISVRTPPRVLRWLYGALVSVIAAGLWYDIFTGR
ncbi:MAG: sulfite exporter TauE/SafE family protein [Chloroflexota bacterium]